MRSSGWCGGGGRDSCGRGSCGGRGCVVRGGQVGEEEDCCSFVKEGESNGGVLDHPYHLTPTHLIAARRRGGGEGEET